MLLYPWRDRREKNLDYLIVANGPFLPREILIEAALNRKIIALDGAATQLAKLGIKPHVILGDFDSIDDEGKKLWGITATFSEITNESKPYPGKNGVTIVPSKDQNLTDLTKAIRYCDQQGAKSIDIVCAVGTDRMDFTIGNIRTLRGEYRKERIIRLHTDTQTLIFVADNKTFIEGDIGDYCGIVSFPSASFTSQGLEYNGTNYLLKFGFTDSICNRLQQTRAEIIIQGEALIIHPGQLKSQKSPSKSD